MRTKINYELLCSRIALFYDFLEEKIDEIMRYELPEEVLEIMLEIETLLKTGEINFASDLRRNPHKYIYEAYIENLDFIKEHFKTLLFITGREGKRISKISLAEKEELCEELDIPLLSEQFEGVSDDLRTQIRSLISKIRHVERQASKYTGTKKDITDYTDEVEEERGSD